MKPNYTPNSFDTFSVLASSGSSNLNSRATTPSNINRPQGQQMRPVAQGGTDAFSSLLGSSFSSSSNTTNMSLADRQAAALKERQNALAQKQSIDAKEASVWSGLDMIGKSSVPLQGTKSTPNPTIRANDDDWIFDKVTPSAPGPPKSTTPSSSSLLEDDWGLSDFASQPTSSRTPPQAKSNDPMSLFETLGDTSTSYGQNKSHPVVGLTPDDGEDDILGMLGRPVEAIPKRTTPDKTDAPVSRNSRPTRSDSPPPHLIGQIVEMGFSPQQARLALASTDSGLDVQQALETLLANGVGSEEAREAPRPRRGLAQYQDEEEDWDEHRSETHHSQRPSQARQTSQPSQPRRTQTESPSLVSNDIQERADKLISQASEIGLNMFNRANALWKDGRDKVQKAYEERAARNKPVNDGRPRWMSEIPSETNDHDQRNIPENASGSFRDDNDDSRETVSQKRNAREPESRKRIPQNLIQPTKSREPNLFDDEPTVYVSPARRRPAASQVLPQAVASTSQAAPVPQRPSRPSPAPVLRTRQTVSASLSVISTSNTKKAKGTELFKLGQYANAADAYTSALSGLPEKHLLTIPLYNNRALSRIKIGEHSGAVEDCTAVISIIGLDYHPSQEAKVTREEEGASVDLADALLKALRRRAEALEGREKWDLAQKDWETIINCTWSSKMRSDAQTGATRCRKMLSAERDPPPRKPAPPRPTVARTASSKPNVDYEAVKKLRQANQEKEKEEETKLALKDSVDSRLNAWKAGKETNIRALVASLDTVLWPELGWQKIGMHELVTPGQVKIRYMKAIAKLHPDKLNSGNTTLEQRMIANGVFAALNDAWLAFKQ